MSLAVLKSRALSGMNAPEVVVEVHLANSLPIALGILAASGQIPKDMLDHFEYAGELALTGALRPVRGALAMTVNIAQAQKILSQLAQENRAFILSEERAAKFQGHY